MFSLLIHHTTLIQVSSRLHAVLVLVWSVVLVVLVSIVVEGVHISTRALRARLQKRAFTAPVQIYTAPPPHTHAHTHAHT